MAQDSIISGLFGLTPEMYQRSQAEEDQKAAMQFARLSPLEQASAGFYSAGMGLGRGIGTLLGAEDEQLKKITALQNVAKNIDYSDPLSIKAGVEALSGIDPASAMRVAQYGQNLLLRQSEIAKNLQPQKLTGEERYLNILSNVESNLRAGKPVSDDALSQANMAGQMISKPRNYFDAQTGQTVSVPATDPSKAYPLLYAQFKNKGMELEAKPGTTQVTEGNLPSTSQKRISEIEGSLTKLEQSNIDLNGFVNALRNNEVKYDATSNTFDFLGSILPPAFGFKEQGNQVKKDEINRALKDRVNTLLLQAKGTQTEGDAQRASDLIADKFTYLSQERMIGAIESLIRAENKLKNELVAEQQSLRQRGQPEKPTAQPGMSAPRQAAPSPRQTTPTTQAKPVVKLTDDQKIELFINKNTRNGVGPTKEEARNFLRSRGLLTE